MKNKNYWIILGLFSGLLFGIATPFSKVLLSNLNSFQLSGLLYLGSGIVIIPQLIKNMIKTYKNRKYDKYYNKYNNINNINSDNTSPNNINQDNINSDNIHYSQNIDSNEELYFNSQDVKKSAIKKNIINFDINLLKIIFIVLFGGILGPLFLMMGLSHTSASSTAIWLNMELVATAIIGIVLFKDHLDKYGFIGLLLTFIAGLIVSWGNDFGDFYSIIFIIMACFSWGIDNQLTSIVDGYSPEVITFIKGIFGGGVNFVIGMFIAGQFIPLNLLFYGIILGIVSYGLSIVFFVSSAQNLGATRSQILFSTAPFWGILFSILFIGDPLTLNLIIATLFLVFGIIITNNLVHKHKHYHVSMEHIHIHSHDDGHHEHNHNFFSEEEMTGDNKNKKHIHKHKHNEKEHDHNHFPDLHHKHDH
ncbi:EamA family transporter [Methanobrevibacter sp. TMH8]|uniref:DMT family transporter n=1 Tax=Methanobrevibacter sp. TMH8 TaxID=2848611 RepID=UPI001CCE98AA|nr:DMT family transporter [Methanobrevibacter sp. TMH8]MBZ9571021.1 EamA family transporter [Methanobrevibacter sp. TMH8]